jgi:hypothetical protein
MLISLLAQTTVPSPSPTGYELPTWAIAILVAFGGIVAILVAFNTILWPSLFNTIKKVKEDLHSVDIKSTAAKAATDVNTQRITNVSLAHAQTEQSVTSMATKIGETAGAVKALKDTLPS